MSTVLVDMDGVLANWGGAYDRHLERVGAPEVIRRHANQTSFDLFEGLIEEEHKQVIREIMDHPGFYRDLEPMAGAALAMEDMLWAGHDVFICTSPWPTNPTCASDKMAWVIEHLGKDWAKRLIITSDKTIVTGHYLIDDKPDIKGIQRPWWTQILFHQPYNINSTQPRMMHWGQWREHIR